MLRVHPLRSTHLARGSILRQCTYCALTASLAFCVSCFVCTVSSETLSGMAQPLSGDEIQWLREEFFSLARRASNGPTRLTWNEILVHPDEMPANVASFLGLTRKRPGSYQNSAVYSRVEDDEEEEEDEEGPEDLNETVDRHPDRRRMPKRSKRPEQYAEKKLPTKRDLLWRPGRKRGMGQF